MFLNIFWIQNRKCSKAFTRFELMQ